MLAARALAVIRIQMAGMIGQPYLDPAQLASVTAIRSAITRLRMLDFIGPGTRQDMR
jgi:hypothetical protein